MRQPTAYGPPRKVSMRLNRQRRDDFRSPLGGSLPNLGGAYMRSLLIGGMALFWFVCQWAPPGRSSE